ncbi:MAG: pyridoxal phosphate-dependent aminotransferase family protein [Helicobacteraceae bacterium]|jgi:8-amino-7-oxononanoate synthase|nr:pyridoxal phosphate-dependent aminotransferase family protein [Helicobacteraceae bacterium]
MFEEELNALARADRLRRRCIFSPDLIDLASNDYLGLASNERIFERALDRVRRAGQFGAKASQLVSGYTQIHRDFENFEAKRHGFEAAIVIGSGFLGNIALFETLARKGDLLLIDEEFHASGLLASRLARSKAEFFAHNSPDDLRSKLLAARVSIKPKRIFVAIEGVYSMSGAIADREIFNVARDFGAAVILDEAHSGGVLGAKLNGVLDYYKIAPEANETAPLAAKEIDRAELGGEFRGINGQSFLSDRGLGSGEKYQIVRLGTLGKAFGSYGAYILAAREIIDFLTTKAKPIIYSTAPSLFDIAFALEAARFIARNEKSLRFRAAKARQIAAEFGYETPSLILPIAVKSSKAAVDLQKKLLKRGFLVGAIRPPTTKTPQLRVILRESPANLRDFFAELQKLI